MTSPTPTNDQIVALKILLKFAEDHHVLMPCSALKVAAEDENKATLRSLAEMLQVEAYNECIGWFDARFVLLGYRDNRHLDEDWVHEMSQIVTIAWC